MPGLEREVDRGEVVMMEDRVVVSPAVGDEDWMMGRLAESTRAATGTSTYRFDANSGGRGRA